MLSWGKVAEFARDLVKHVFLLNLTVWEPDYEFGDCKTEEPVYTESMKEKVFALTLSKHHEFSNYWEVTEKEAAGLSYEDFVSKMETKSLFANSARKNLDEFLLNCTAVAYLGMNYYHKDSDIGPYYAVLAIVDKYLQLFENATACATKA